MSFAKTAVSRPTTIFIIFVLLLCLGGFALVNLPIDLTPEISPPYLVVLTTYAGAGPEEVERSITRPIEGSLSNVSNLEKLTSTSSKGTSMITMQFAYRTDLADASASVRDNIDMVKSYLPSGAGSPLLIKYNPSMIPIMGLMVTSANRTPDELREVSENTILPRIEQTPGVATGSVSGGREKIIRVEIPQTRLEAYGLTVTQLQAMISSQNMQVAAGSITDNGLSYILTTMGEYTSLEQIKDTVIAYKGGGMVNGQVELPKTVRLRDIADVFEGFRDESSVVYVNGVPAIQITVQKQSGKNSVQTARDLRTRLVQIAREIPSDIKITEIYNTTDQIENSINQVAEAAISGALLAIIVVFIFLRSIKPTVIIGVSIPVSVIITIMLMYFAGLTLNIMTLAGLCLGVGMLVDNSIVILENIYHYREKGAKLSTASVIGTQEMLIAIIGSTLTTICVFAPLVMFQGLLEMIGELFFGLAFTVVISLAMSLFVAMVLVPVLSSHYLPLVTRKQKPLRNVFLAGIDKAFDGFFKGMERGYKRSVSWVLRHKAITIAVIVLLFIGSLAMIPTVGLVFMPTQESDSVSVSVTLPVGSPLSDTEAVLKQLEAIVQKEVQGYERITVTVGSGGGMSLLGGGGGGSTNTGSLQINLPPFEERIDTDEVIQAKLRNHFNDFAGVSFNLGTSGGMSMSMGGNPIDIVVRVDDLTKGKAIAEQIANVLRDKTVFPEVTEPDISLDDGLPQIELQLDRERLYALGLNTFTVGNEIKAAVDGLTATRYKDNGIEYDVVLILAEADRDELPDLDQIFVNSQIAGRVPLSNFASYAKGTGPISIQRENQSRVIRVTAGALPGVKLNDLQTKVQAAITAAIPAEDDVIIEYAGDYAELMKYMQRFALIMAVAILLVFGVMASLFESFRDPFIVIFTIPLSFIGIIAIYLISNEPLNILSAVGLLVLVGVIVNNGIVLVDYTNMLRKRGYPLHDACVEAAGNRLRPILMSTLTTIIGLVPMAFFPGEGSEMTAPIGKTVLGGLSFGTMMTLFLMPTIYFIMNRGSDKRKAKQDARRERIAAGLTRKQAQERQTGAASVATAKMAEPATTKAPFVGGDIILEGEAGL
ncbi:MAG: efflux RND transporter permease subunit [Treponema sp.]|jgi:HAE1 family hydrophobic/amphiphilic exporter-1|nr:efflux RND transporter permease subunit [Treponema sp.]